MSALAKRAVACKGWHVMVGMVNARGDAVRSVATVGGELWWWDGFGQASLAANFAPDIGHPATLGCTEHGLLPELYGPDAMLMRGPTGWGYGIGATSFIAPCSSKKEALVAALEAKS